MIYVFERQNYTNTYCYSLKNMDICNIIHSKPIYMERIGIFCSASNDISHVFIEKTKELGIWLGSNKKTIVYGGSNQGLMEVVGRAAKENGGTLMGVVPTKLEEKGKVSSLLDIEFKTVNLSDRKEVMLRESDIMIALPGGIGTLDEIFHIMAEATIGYHSKKVILYNVDGFWNNIISFISELDKQNFIHKPLDQVMGVANNLEELIKFIEE